jgi:hypothetical protein
MEDALDTSLLADIARVRRVLARELETISEYESAALASTRPEVRAFLMHLAAEEKEHVAEATHVLRLLDPGQDAHFTKPVATGHFQGAAAAGAPQPAPPTPAPAPAAPEPYMPLPPQRVLHAQQAPPSALAPPLTVGSLKRRDR